MFEYNELKKGSPEYGSAFFYTIFFGALVVSQFFICPLFFNINLSAKFILFSFLVYILILFSDLKVVYYQRSFLIFIAFFLLTALASTIASENGLTAVSSLYQLTFYLIYVLVLVSISSEKIINKTLYFIAAIVVISSVLGLYEYFSSVFTGSSKGSLIPYLMPTNKNIRVAGPYGQPNLFSVQLIAGLIVMHYLHIHTRVFLDRNRLYLFRYIPTACVALVFFLTGSRSGLLCFIAVACVITYSYFKKDNLLSSTDNRHELIYFTLVVLASFVVSVLLNGYFSNQAVRALASTEVLTNNIESRFIFWTSAVLIFLSNPWFGVGLDNYKYFLDDFVITSHNLLGFVQYEAMGYTKWAHNELLQVLCECGLLAFISLVVVLILYLYRLCRICSNASEIDIRSFYFHLFPLPFIFISMFSWPMRHHSLLVLFFTFVALLLSTYPLERRTLTKSISRPLMSIVLIAVIFTMYLGYNEVRLGAFADRLKKQDIETSLDELDYFYTIDYLRYPLIEKTSPYLTKRILENRDPKLASRLLPYLKDLVEIQGSHWQWFNLSQTYFVLNMHAEAKKAINKAIELWPVESKYWSFQHYINMLEVAEKTGRPLEDFLPIPPGGDAKDLDGMFDFEGRKFIEM